MLLNSVHMLRCSFYYHKTFVKQLKINNIINELQILQARFVTTVICATIRDRREDFTFNIWEKNTGPTNLSCSVVTPAITTSEIPVA